MSLRSGLIVCPAWVLGFAAILMLGSGMRAGADDDAQTRVVVAGTVVDEAGAPVAGARVSASAVAGEPVAPATTDARGAFRLSLPTNRAGRVYNTLVARPADGRLGVKPVAFEAAKPEPATITVKPARPLEVRVVDGAGRPVAGAEVHALADLHQVASGRTDDQGRWTTHVPSDITNAWRVYARKSKVGFDYAQAERARGSAEPPRTLPEQLTLTLDGARPPLRIRTVDRDGTPLAGVEVGPWLIQKPGQESPMNGMQDAFVRTDAAGIASFDWLPARLEGTVAIVSRSKTHHAPDQSTRVDPDRPDDEVTLTLLPLEALSGRVTTADGRPAAGATVRVEGQGAGRSAYRGETLTGADGRYWLKVHSEQAYLLTATRDDLAAPYKAGVVVRAGTPAAGVDLVLGPGTRLTGRVTVGKDGKPAPNVGVSAVIDGGSIPPELKRDGDRIHHSLSLNLWTRTDAEGRYDFLLGPGEYRIQGPARVEPVTLTIPADNPPRTLVRDLVMPRAARGPLAIAVVDEAGRPVADALVDGAYQAQTAHFSRVTADARGTVRLERALDPLVLAASTPDRSRRGSIRVDAEATEATVVVQPTATAAGRLVDPQGKPIPGLKLSYGVRVHLGPSRNSPFSWHFGGTATTDAQGGFRLPGILVGETYDLYTHHEAERRLSTARTPVKPDGPGPIALGDVPIDLSPPRPYVPPTPAERTREAFAARPETTPRQKLDDMLVEARREATRPLLLFGDPKDPACVELFRLFNGPSGGDGARGKTPADLRWEFELAALDSGRADVRTLARDLGIGVTPDGGGGPPCLAVLSTEGTLAATDSLRPGPGAPLDPRALADFLRAHALPTRDAEAMLSEGLSRAKAGDKRVFLIMSASWCGPCRRLARFLDANRAELERHYDFVKLDVSRDAHARELRDRYEGKNASNGVPWYVILDAAGTPLVTSNAKELREEFGSGNVGFPSSKAGIDHFVTMLRQTAPGLTDQALASLRRELETQP